MILKLEASLLDKKYLAIRSKKTVPISTDFLKLIVNKPWGQEYLLFKSPSVEIWHLSINQYKTTSMHCHPRKKTTLVILEGRALFSSLNRSVELKPRDAVIMEKGIFHSTQAISEGGICVLEFETPPMKHDLIRLEDKYGRINKGYEGLENMIKTSNAVYRFTEKDMGKTKELSNNHLCIHQIKSRRDFNSIADEKSGILVLLNGTVLDQDGHQLCNIAEATTINHLLTKGYLFNDVFALSIHPQKTE